MPAAWKRRSGRRTPGSCSSERPRWAKTSRPRCRASRGGAHDGLRRRGFRRGRSQGQAARLFRKGLRERRLDQTGDQDGLDPPERLSGRGQRTAARKESTSRSRSARTRSGDGQGNRGATAGRKDVTEADIIVAGGRSLKSEENSRSSRRWPMRWAVPSAPRGPQWTRGTRRTGSRSVKRGKS